MMPALVRARVKRGDKLVHMDYGPCEVLKVRKSDDAVFVRLADGTEGTTTAHSLRRRLDDVRTIEDYAVIIRCIHTRGFNQAEAIAELERRRLWLTEDQQRQAGLSAARDGLP